MATSTNFDEIVKKHAESLAKIEYENEARTDQRKQWWQDRVVSLIDEIGNWLDVLITANVIKLTRPYVSISEEKLGTYDIQSGLVQLGKEKLIFRPVGTMIQGGVGRIDVEGSSGKAMLILRHSNEKVPSDDFRTSSTWFVTNSSDRSKLTPFTREAFETLFVDLMGIKK
jgi:hypothetical protein